MDDVVDGHHGAGVAALNRDADDEHQRQRDPYGGGHRRILVKPNPDQAGGQGSAAGRPDQLWLAGWHGAAMLVSEALGPVAEAIIPARVMPLGAG